MSFTLVAVTRRCLYCTKPQCFMQTFCFPSDVNLAFIQAKPLHVLDLGVVVHAGFPSPAEDIGARRIDLTAELVKHPQATFLLRARGDSMRDAGIADGDVLVVDKAVAAKNGHVVIAVIDGEFVCKHLQVRAGRIKLKAANPSYPDIVPKDGQTVEVWGVVTASIKTMPV